MSLWRIGGETIRFLQSAQWSNQVQQIEDSAYRFAESVTDLDDEGQTTSATIKTFGANVALTATFKGRPSFGPIPTGTKEVVIEAIVDDEEHGTMKISQFGVKDNNLVPFTRSSFRGGRANEQVHSYLANLFRRLAAEAYNSHIGARDTPPGISLSLDDVAHFASVGIEVAVSRRFGGGGGGSNN